LKLQIQRLLPDLLRERTFFLVWLVEVVAISAGHVSHLALPIIGTVVLHATPSQMGLLVGLQALPFTLFSLVMGVWVDRASKKKLMIWCYVVLFTSLALLPLAWWWGMLTLPLLYLVGFNVGAVMALFGVAHQVLVTHVVGRERLVDAYRIISTTESLIRLGAPAAAGFLIEALGAPLSVTLEVVLLVAALALFSKVHEPASALPQPQLQAKPQAPELWLQIKEGLRYVWDDMALRVIAATAACWQILWHGFLALHVLFATRELHMSAGQIGLAHLFGGVGALLAGVVMKRLNLRFSPGWVMGWGLMMTAVAWGLFAVLPSAAPWNVLSMGAAMFVLDFGAVCFFVNYISMRQILTPDALLGRVTATMRWASVALAPAGAVASGSIAEWMGLRPTFAALGILGCATCFALMKAKSVHAASAQAFELQRSGNA
jgi:Na+/melibiose symporter-like transporter